MFPLLVLRKSSSAKYFVHKACFTIMSPLLMLNLLALSVGDLFRRVRERQPWADPKVVKVLFRSIFALSENDINLS